MTHFAQMKEIAAKIKLAEREGELVVPWDIAMGN